jgi:hypothetical protein
MRAISFGWPCLLEPSLKCRRARKTAFSGGWIAPKKRPPAGINVINQMEEQEEQYWSEEDIPDEIRAGLKTVYADPDPGRWAWDESTWRWELSLYSDEKLDGEGYVYIAPCENGKPCEYAIVPGAWHDEWVIGNISPKDIYISGTLQEARVCL